MTGSRFVRGALAFIGAVYAVRAATLVLNAITMPRLRPAAPSQRPRVSLLVPARGEVHTLPGLLPQLAAQGAHEVIVCDDGDNGPGLDEAGALGIQVISSDGPPPGWAGKNWACHRLAQAATGDVLVFTDADTVWHPGALDAVLACRERVTAGLPGPSVFSVLPRTDVTGLGARLLAPLVENIVLTHAPWPLLCVDRLGRGTACGALMVLSRADHDRLGGHAALAGVVQEDIALARLAQQHGGSARVVLGGELVGVRWYRTYADSVAGLGKSLVATLEGSRALAVVSLALYGATHTLPWLLPATPGVVAARTASVADRTIVNLVLGRRRPADLAEGLLGPVTPLAGLPALVVGLRRRLVWKGRSYPSR